MTPDKLVEALKGVRDILNRQLADDLMNVSQYTLETARDIARQALSDYEAAQGSREESELAK